MHMGPRQPREPVSDLDWRDDSDRWWVPPEVESERDWHIVKSLYPVLEGKHTVSLEEQVQLIHKAVVDEVTLLSGDIGELPQTWPFSEEVGS
jgi:hypothetical protein